jgi:hypothetical protein
MTTNSQRRAVPAAGLYVGFIVIGGQPKSRPNEPNYRISPHIDEDDCALLIVDHLQKENIICKHQILFTKKE